jgi:predicted DCC family thiol-disulfide oxidoreductase YuxK
MTESSIIYLCLSIAFVFALFMTKKFFLQNSNFYSTRHAASIHTGGRKDGGGNIVFFDGVCVLCRESVAKLLRIDKKRVLRYSSLQGIYAQNILSTHSKKSGDSVLFLRNGHLYEKSEAVIKILSTIGGPYQLVALFLNAFPLLVLNWLYDIVAEHRYRLFGKSNECLLPTDEVKELFIP